MEKSRVLPLVKPPSRIRVEFAQLIHDMRAAQNRADQSLVNLADAEEARRTRRGMQGKA